MGIDRQNSTVLPHQRWMEAQILANTLLLPKAIRNTASFQHIFGPFSSTTVEQIITTDS